MKVLRVYWIDHKYNGTVENHKAVALEHRYKTIERSTDFHPHTDIEDAYSHIISLHGERPKNGGVVNEWAEIISHNIVNAEQFEKPEINFEQRYQDPLFDGVSWSGTFGKKPANSH